MQQEVKHIAAIEIGSSKIRGAIGSVDAQGTLTVLAVEEKPLIDGVRYGVIRNVEKVAIAVDSILTSLDATVAPRSIESVYVSIGGRSVHSAVSSVDRLLPDEMEITRRLLDELKLEALSLAPSGVDVVSAEPRSFAIDRVNVEHPVGEFGRDVSACFNLILCSDKMRRNLERVLVEKLSLTVNGYYVRAVVEADYAVSANEKKLGCMFVDCGAETTTVAIYRQGNLQYLNTIPIGSRNITRDIMTLNYLEEQAEGIKQTGGNARPQTGDKNMINGMDFSIINKYVSARASEIILNINAQLKYADLTPQELPAGIILAGGGARLGGFSDRMEALTKMRVRSAAGTPGTVRIADSRIPVDEMFDIIALLSTVAANEPAECLSAPPVKEEPKLETIPDDPAQDENNPEDVPDSDDTPKKEGRGGYFKRFTSKIVSIMSGLDDKDPDDDFEDDM